MKYFRIRVKYTERGSVSVHVVKATTAKKALRTAEKFGIAFPFNSPEVINRICEKMDMRKRVNKWVIRRRKNGHGGHIWYEDKDGNLQKET